MDHGTILQYIKCYHLPKHKIDKLVSSYALINVFQMTHYTVQQLSEIAQGLVYVHHNSVVHGDLRGVSTTIMLKANNLFNFELPEQCLNR